MREVDQALARFYAQRPQASRAERDSAEFPPPPHLPPPPPGGFGPPSLAIEWPSMVTTLERLHGERFARLAETLSQTAKDRGLRSLFFTSCHRAEGRSTLVLTLARALGRGPCRTVVVDADLNGPMLARSLGVRPDAGLDDVVDSGRALDDAMLDAADDGLTLLPLRKPVGHPRAFLASPGWAAAMARLRREFDMVLLDGGPLFAGLGPAVLPRAVDAAVLVRSRALTGDRNLARARDVLAAGGVPLLGIAETFT